jgi:hypothetical protein
VGVVQAIALVIQKYEVTYADVLDQAAAGSEVWLIVPDNNAILQLRVVHARALQVMACPQGIHYCGMLRIDSIAELCPAVVTDAGTQARIALVP